MGVSMSDTTVPRLDPISAATLIGDSYRRYLKSRHQPGDRRLRNEFHRALDAFQLHKGPFIQTTPPYRQGISIDGLITDETLHRGFAKVGRNVFPTERPLYLHQERAIRKARAGRNLVIATGTGSGKTECYLFPILDYLLRERDAGTLADPGVRAMLLYPMNALANDQMQRLRDMLRPFPEIKYGRFIDSTGGCSFEPELLA